MSIPSQDKPDRPYWSWEGFTLGARLALPALPGLVAFGLAVGTTAARKGFGLLDALLMNWLVFAGASQMVAMEIWPERLTTGAVLAVALVAATVNARMLLMGASLRPWFGPLPWWQSYPMLHLITDPSWIIAMRYRAGGGNDAAFFLGGGIICFAFWNAAAAAGYLLGALVQNPRALALDLVMPIFFSVMLIPLWRGARRGIAWAVAGGVALLVERLVPGFWFILAGAVAGAVAEGMWSDDD